MSVYHFAAPPFARESMRWSADAENIARYQREASYPGKMPDINIGVQSADLEEALLTLPPEEREYTGSKAARPSWPYER